MLPRQSHRFGVVLGSKLPAMTADVSLGGFCAEMPAVFLPGSVVDGKMEVGEDVVPFRGVIAWARPGTGQHRSMSRFGVRFTQVDGKLFKLLEAQA